MTQLKKTVEPFGEVNVYPGTMGGTRVVATILMEPQREGAQTGIALDGSGSMRKLYGQETGGGVVSSIFKKAPVHNDIAPVAQQLCAYLARKIDADGGTTCIYWAVGPDGKNIEVVGDLRAEEAETYPFKGPSDFGTGTQLLPAVRYFVERFKDAPWGFFVFITDGELFDLDAVKQYSTQLAQAVASGRRNPLKFVLIGLGPEVNEKQLEDLDDLDTGTAIDLWDYKLAAEMKQLQEIFAEVVDRNARVADNGKILDPQGRVVKNYSDTGLPALLTFDMPAGAAYFTLEVNGQQIHQPLSDQAAAPVSGISPSRVPAAAPPRATPPPLPEFVSSPAPSSAIPVAIPVLKPAPTAIPVPPAAPVAEKKEAKKEGLQDFDLEDLANSIELEFEKPSGDTGIELDKQDGK
jgi:hypothetical protein